MAINSALADAAGIPQKVRDKIEVLHDIRDEIRNDLRTAIENERKLDIDRLLDNLLIVNYTLQDLWNFKRDPKKHREVFY